MRFPYTEVGSGIHRPLVPVAIYGPSGLCLADGLVDSGADRTLISPKLARNLGIEVEGLEETVTVRSATGHPIICKITNFIFELRRDSRRIRWRAEVGVASQTLQRCVWGYRGFLEYFRAKFDGPARVVTLTATSNLPKVKAPS